MEGTVSMSAGEWILKVLIPQDGMEFWTAVLAVATIALVLVAWKGLKSLKLARIEMLNRAKRESCQATIDKAREWAEVLIPKNAALLKAFAAHSVPVFVHKASEVRFEPDNKEDLAKALEWYKQLPPRVAASVVHVLNNVEAWAMHFTLRLADADAGRHTLAPSYCSIVVQCYAVLLVLRAKPTSGNYPHLVKLFQTWIEDMEEDKRSEQIKDTVRQLEKLQDKSRNPRDRLQGPIGTNLDEELDT